MTTTQKAFDPGIYFNLDEATYHADPALGSTDIRKLRQNPSSYWYSSWMNPHRPPDKGTPGRTRGRAMHKLVYEGEKAFDEIYMRGAEHDADMTPSEKASLTKEANKRAATLNKIALPAVDYDQVAIASAMITKNPELKSVFTGGASEVSVFWQRSGIRLKARLDYLKPRGVGDLKGCANTKGIAFPAACRNDITNYSYHIQAKHYLDARAVIPQLIRDNAVHGAHENDFLDKLLAAKVYGWQWLFYQIEGAPITWSAVLSPQNPILELAARSIDQALANFVDYRDRFGTDMWLLIEEPRELPIEEMPSWFGR